MSPSWETISAPRHIFLMLANPVHRLTFTEVQPVQWGSTMHHAAQICKLHAVPGRVLPSWETILAPRHIFLMLANSVHWLTFTEVWP